MDKARISEMLIFLVFLTSMPWYFISYTSGAGKKIKGFKEFHIRNVDDAFSFFKDKVKLADPDHSRFNCVMISTKSEDWQEWNRNRYKSRYG
jgi:hypothetical protein